VSAIAAESLRKEFQDGLVAVSDIDLSVEEAEIFGFLGPNGAGKTTTVRMLTTLLKPTSGRATVSGFDVAERPNEVRRRIGVALQEAGLDGMATGRELLVLQGRLYGLRREEPADRAAELLELVGLTQAADRRVKTYSGGMKRRLDLASALVHHPRVLFLDEPTAGLDPASREGIWEEVRRLNQEEGITVFLTTQYLEEADRLADRLVIIDHGRIVSEGAPEELKRSIGADVVTVEVPPSLLDRAREVLMSSTDAIDVRTERSEITLFVNDGRAAAVQAIRALDRAGVSVGSLSVAHPTLDEVFLRATGSRLEGAEGDSS
jgi:ABC-2 type transport system ATP-binding protein